MHFWSQVDAMLSPGILRSHIKQKTRRRPGVSVFMCPGEDSLRFRPRTFSFAVAHENFSALLVRPLLRKRCPDSPSSPLLVPQRRSAQRFRVGRLALCAQERTRTSKPLRALPPQGSTSTSFATWAIFFKRRGPLTIAGHPLLFKSVFMQPETLLSFLQLLPLLLPPHLVPVLLQQPQPLVLPALQLRLVFLLL